MKRDLLAFSLIALTALTGACGSDENEARDLESFVEEYFNEDGSFGNYDEGGNNDWANYPTNSYGNEEGGYGYVCTDGACVDYGY